MKRIKVLIIIMGLIAIIACKNDLLQAVKDGQPTEKQEENNDT